VFRGSGKGGRRDIKDETPRDYNYGSRIENTRQKKSEGRHGAGETSQNVSSCQWVGGRRRALGGRVGGKPGSVQFTSESRTWSGLTNLKDTGGEGEDFSSRSISNKRAIGRMFYSCWVSWLVTQNKVKNGELNDVSKT